MSRASLTGPTGERGWGMLPRPRPHLSGEGKFSLFTSPWGKKLPYSLMEESHMSNRESDPIAISISYL
jgi:hypothetical protein